jgi:ribonuclease HI
MATEEDVKLSCYFDGSMGPSGPKAIAAYGYVVKDEEGKTVHSSSGRAAKGVDASCNVAEFSGLYAAMFWVHTHQPEAEVVFYGDSQLVIMLMRGEAKARKGKYLPYYRKAIALALPYIEKKQWSFEWIGRAMNSEADKLSQYRF